MHLLLTEERSFEMKPFECFGLTRLSLRVPDDHSQAGSFSCIVEGAYVVLQLHTLQAHEASRSYKASTGHLEIHAQKPIH